MNAPLTELVQQLPGLDRYERIKALGRGGYAIVFLAHDDFIDRQVALKVVDLTGAPDTTVQRLELEARAAGRLNHPGIVSIYDAGRRGDLFYIVMEYVEGATLQQRLEKETQLPWQESLRIIASLAQALHHAHEQGVIHRDVKPANVLIGDGGLLKLTDFGVARMEDTGLTADDRRVGTLAYMAPEYLARGEVSPRTDLFSLGVLLYQMLTGEKPFEGESIVEVASTVVRGYYTPLKTHVPDLPDEVEAICRRCLQAKPELRFTTAEELAQSIQQLLQEAEHEQVPVPAQTSPGLAAANLDPTTESSGSPAPGLVSPAGGTFSEEVVNLALSGDVSVEDQAAMLATDATGSLASSGASEHWRDRVAPVIGWLEDLPGQPAYWVAGAALGLLLLLSGLWSLVRGGEPKAATETAQVLAEPSSRGQAGEAAAKRVPTNTTEVTVRLISDLPYGVLEVRHDGETQDFPFDFRATEEKKGTFTAKLFLPLGTTSLDTSVRQGMKRLTTRVDFELEAAGGMVLLHFKRGSGLRGFFEPQIGGAAVPRKGGETTSP